MRCVGQSPSITRATTGHGGPYHDRTHWSCAWRGLPENAPEHVSSRRAVLVQPQTKGAQVEVILQLRDRPEPVHDVVVLNDAPRVAIRLVCVPVA
jgi:hypothetical protein